MTDDKHAVYRHDELPGQVTRKLFITYKTGGWNAGCIGLWDCDITKNDTDYLLLGETEVTVAIPPDQDLRGKLLSSLEGEKQRVLADNHQRLKAVQEKIDHVLAIEYQPPQPDIDQSANDLPF